MKAISIILVTYNSSAHIESCLDSIFAQDFKDYEVLVIDNASEDKARAILGNMYPNITLIKNPVNYGFSKALNQGIAKASGKFILCLNNDIKLQNNFLKSIYKAIDRHEKIGAVQPVVFKTDGKTIDTTGISLSFLRRFYDVGKGKMYGGRFTEQQYIFGACAAAALYRREALESVKHSNGEYFDEDFFCIAEDVDISWRMQNKGWKILYCPEAVCIHFGGISRRNDKINQYFSMRNRYLTILKNESFLGFLKFFIIFFIYDLWRNLYMSIVNPKYFLKALSEIMKLLPKILEKRWDKR